MPSFDRVARAYRWLEALSFGRALTRTREEYLPLLGAQRRALLLGDGDGRFLAALLRRNTALEALAVDASGRMLQLLSERCGDVGGRLKVLQGDLRSDAGELLGDQHTYDLVISHFFLDCLHEDDLRQLTGLVRERLEPSALWVVSEFRVPPHGPLRPVAKLLIGALYLAFGLLTGLAVRGLPPYPAILRAAGFELVAQRFRLRGLLTAELWRAGPIA